MVYLRTPRYKVPRVSLPPVKIPSRERLPPGKNSLG